MRRQKLIGFLSVVALVAASCSTEPEAAPATTTEVVTTTTTVPEPDRLIALADVADCRGPDVEVAELIDSLDGEIVMVGDLAGDGNEELFEECFRPLYDDDLSRLHAVPGDNIYESTGDGAPFWENLGEFSGGQQGFGWWTFNLGNWQIIGLNSQCKEVDWCGPASPQYQFLKGALQARPDACRVALWHVPRFSSSQQYRGIAATSDLYQLLYDHGTDLLLAGHSHHYERFEPLGVDGQPDAAGIANFTIGIGGHPWVGFGEPLPGSQVRNDVSRGVLMLELFDDRYDFEFLAAHDDATLVDSGSARCQNAG